MPWGVRGIRNIPSIPPGTPADIHRTPPEVCFPGGVSDCKKSSDPSQNPSEKFQGIGTVLIYYYRQES